MEISIKKDEHQQLTLLRTMSKISSLKRLIFNWISAFNDIQKLLTINIKLLLFHLKFYVLDINNAYQVLCQNVNA